MSQMKELYDKVSKDTALQLKFNQILAEAEETGKDAAAEKLLTFAQEAGFSVNVNEMMEFFQTLQEQPEGELSDLELDMVAGGKNRDRDQGPQGPMDLTPKSSARNIFCPIVDLFGGFPEHLM